MIRLLACNQSKNDTCLNHPFWVSALSPDNHGCLVFPLADSSHCLLPLRFGRSGKTSGRSKRFIQVIYRFFTWPIFSRHCLLPLCFGRSGKTSGRSKRLKQVIYRFYKVFKGFVQVLHMFYTIFLYFYNFIVQIANSLKNSLVITERKHKSILSQDLKTTFKQYLTCMKKTQYQFSFVHFVLDDPVHIEVYNWVLKSVNLR